MWLMVRLVIAVVLVHLMQMVLMMLMVMMLGRLVMLLSGAGLLENRSGRCGGGGRINEVLAVLQLQTAQMRRVVVEVHLQRGGGCRGGGRRHAVHWAGDRRLQRRMVGVRRRRRR